MNPAVVGRALLTRIQADTTLYSAGWTSALAGGASFNRASDSAPAYPYIVYNIDVNGENYFGGLAAPFELTITVFDLDGNGTDKLEVVIDRIIGDSTLASGTNAAPTYGLHNHKLALPAIGSTNILGAVCSELNLSGVSIGPSDTIRVNQAVITFNGHLSKQATNV